MKIGIIAHTHFPIREPFAGGLEAHTHMLTRALMQRGHDITLFATPQSDPSLPIHPIHPDTLALDYTILPQMHHTDGQERFMQELHAYQSLMLELRESDFDVIHTNSVHYLPISLAPLLPMPVVTVLHTPPFAWLQSAVLLEQPHQKMNYIFISQALKNLWQGFVRNGDVVHNGIDMQRWAFNPIAGDYAVWTGRMVPEKGAHYAIHAAREAGIKLKLAGAIQDQAYFERAVAPYMSDMITYEGHMDYQALYDLVSNARVFLATPCWEEPFGLTVAEALACGTPVVAFRRGAMPELVKQGAGEVVPFADVNAMAQALLCVMNSANRQHAHDIAQRCFSLDAMVEQYELIYGRLCVSTPAKEKPKLHVV
jgi:glycosyltransferase involved in cell wall biosynthesis